MNEEDLFGAARLDGRAWDLIGIIAREPLDPAGVPYGDSAPLLARLADWAAHGHFLEGQGAVIPPEPSDIIELASWRETQGAMTFEQALSAIAALIGREVQIDVVSEAGSDVICMRGRLQRAEDIGAGEREIGAFADGHDRLMFALDSHPFSEGFFLDRRTFAGAGWDPVDPDGALRIDLRDGYQVLVAVVDEK
ncbi:MAG: hypothetical protein WKF96_02935 [Solirubrobacteraceae bacterium]